MENKEQKRKVRVSLIALGTVVALVNGVAAYKISENKTKKYEAKGLPKKVVVDEITNGKEEPFSRCYEIVGKNNEEVRMYDPQYIYYLINKDTDEIGEYVLLDGSNFNNKKVGLELFDFNNEELLVFEKKTAKLFEEEMIGKDYYHYLLDNCVWIPLDSTSNYIEDVEIKDRYTKEEIHEIKDILYSLYKSKEDINTNTK